MFNSLHSLPAELLEAILDYIPQKRHRWALVTVSKHLYSVLLEPFYRRLALGRVLTPKLVLQLLQKPYRCRSVRHLQLKLRNSRHNSDSVLFRPSEHGYEYYPEVVRMPTESETEQVFSSTSSEKDFIREERTYWNLYVQKTNSEPSDIWSELALVLLASHITFLDIAWRGGEHYQTDLIKRAIARSHVSQMFEALTHLSVGDLHGLWVVDVQEIEIVFDLPNLQTLTGIKLFEFDCEDVSIIKTEQTVSKASKVRHIELSESSGGAGMYHLIRHCPKLESFLYDHSVDRDFGEDLNIKPFELSLRRVARTLKILRLDYSEMGLSMYDPPNDDFDIPFGSFVQFEQLRWLHVRLCNLVRVDFGSNTLEGDLASILPSKLEGLYITMVERRYISALYVLLESLIRKRIRCIPQLTRIDVEGDFLAPELPIEPSSVPKPLPCPMPPRFIDPKICETMQPLVNMAVAAGIQLNIRCNQAEHSMLGLGFPRFIGSFEWLLE